MDKVFIGREQIIIASYFHDSAAPIKFEDLEEALTSGHRAGEVRTYARKREFDTSPSGGDGGKRTQPKRNQRIKTAPVLPVRNQAITKPVTSHRVQSRSIAFNRKVGSY